MIVSALLTSVGINFGLCILFLTLYSILRKQVGNINVYAPRLAVEGSSKQTSRFSLESLLPSPGWVRRAWQASEEELLSSSSLDVIVFVRIFSFSLKLFSLAGVVGIFILLPINLCGTQLNEIDISDIPYKSLDQFSISNVEDGSKRLWIHFCAVYFISVVVCYLLHDVQLMPFDVESIMYTLHEKYYEREAWVQFEPVEYNYISLKRVQCFYASKPQPHQFTILVRGIPVSDGSNINDTVDSFFREYHSSTYLSHVVVRRTSKLHELISDAKELYRRLIHLKSTSHQRNRESGFFGKKVDLVNDYEKKLEDLHETVRRGQSDVSLSGEEVPAAFVSFNSRYGAAIGFQFQQSINPTKWVTEQAPEPSDVYWPFFSTSFLKRWIFKLLVLVASFFLTVLFLIPVFLVQGLTNLNQLEKFFPFLKGLLSIAFVSQVITGYLPSLILQLFLSMVPPIMKIFSSMQGFISNSEIEKSACYKVLWFTVWNIFFANVLSGSALTLFNVFLDIKNIPMKLAVAVPAQASFFIAYVVTSGWTSLSSELFRMFPLIWNYINCGRNANDEFDVPSFPYHSEIPRVLFFGLLGIIFFFLAPLILPFLLAYFFLGYVIYRNQFLNVYAPKYETGGKYWPIVHNTMIFALILLQSIAVGTFGLKKLPLASSLTIPLIVLTLLFNEYCRKRFLPMFKAYPAESLINKDREDQNDPNIGIFLDELVNAYKDPALTPIRYSQNDNEHNAPLLEEARVSS
ncbi:hypothetical protein Sjap_023931 [Stephania japonica]|uniref:Uncharacterized protein n=1 Tax=Stephania japonica TaxID=461633 RepID=A0AAP0ECN4_9MAGN